MAHVQIIAEQGETPRLLIDGVDVANSVRAEGFSLTVHPHLDGVFVARMEILVRKLDVDLPDAVIEAMARHASTDAEEVQQ